jgi:hypothetical protein
MRESSPILTGLMCALSTNARPGQRPGLRRVGAQPRYSRSTARLLPVLRAAERRLADADTEPRHHKIFQESS